MYSCMYVTPLQVLAPTDDRFPTLSSGVLRVSRHVSVRRHFDEAEVPEAGAAPQRLHGCDFHRAAAGQRHGAVVNGNTSV